MYSRSKDGGKKTLHWKECPNFWLVASTKMNKTVETCRLSNPMTDFRLFWSCLGVATTEAQTLPSSRGPLWERSSSWPHHHSVPLLYGQAVVVKVIHRVFWSEWFWAVVFVVMEKKISVHSWGRHSLCRNACHYFCIGLSLINNHKNAKKKH